MLQVCVYLKYLKFNIIHYIGYVILHIIFPVYLNKFFYFQYIACNFHVKNIKMQLLCISDKVYYGVCEVFLIYLKLRRVM